MRVIIFSSNMKRKITIPTSGLTQEEHDIYFSIILQQFQACTKNDATVKVKIIATQCNQGIISAISEKWGKINYEQFKSYYFLIVNPHNEEEFDCITFIFKYK